MVWGHFIRNIFILENQIYDLVDLHKGFTPIGCKHVFKTYKDHIVYTYKRKDRLVVKDCKQLHGVDNVEIFFTKSECLNNFG